MPPPQIQIAFVRILTLDQVAVEAGDREGRMLKSVIPECELERFHTADFLTAPNYLLSIENHS
jgi:hypothetical protein